MLITIGETYLVFLSWSLIFFSISASVRVSRNGHQLSASFWFLRATSTVGKGVSLQIEFIIYSIYYIRHKALEQIAINTLTVKVKVTPYLKAYMRLCQLNCPRTLYAMADMNSPPRPEDNQTSQGIKLDSGVSATVKRKEHKSVKRVADIK